MKMINLVRCFGFAAALCMASGFAAPLLADPYRLVPGDTIELRHSGLSEPETLAVDSDGQLRIPDVGGVDVEGLTLDDAEDTVAAALEREGLFIAPLVSIAMASYAPIIIAGDVASPGRYDFAPGMTIATALAVAGGSQSSGITRLEILRARSESEGQLEALNLDIAAAAVRIARLEAALADKEEVTLPDQLRRLIPAPDRVSLDELLTREHELLVTENERARELLTFWDNEIETVGQQRELYAQRIEVQKEIVETTAQALEDSRSLQERGLQTSTRLAAAQQSSAEARSQMLAMESAQIDATQAIASAQRDRTRFLADERSQNLSDLQTSRVNLDDLKISYARAVRQLALLSDGSSGALLPSDAVDVSFEISSTRAEREIEGRVTQGTRLLPGDTIVVEVTALALDEPS
ncbi:hypothetical protein AYJ57_22590 (plasmid) [Salipiger sp. CCB-MM3]|uniref:polysaccharide biosynthesis/export family protein n=1 Tax=Salipiger sp. CCB-MM3 TaxID=1792508 RepID=UPI00080AA36C|nr:polysaccharide biosynthesis/export family protein [Salipiger sp. CCB-MM3]ANT63266.1 hypothetical protein AYJ57_22590 [Salipiger sp. CCB-MM3]